MNDSGPFIVRLDSADSIHGIGMSKDVDEIGNMVKVCNYLQCIAMKYPGLEYPVNTNSKYRAGADQAIFKVVPTQDKKKGVTPYARGQMH